MQSIWHVLRVYRPYRAHVRVEIETYDHLSGEFSSGGVEKHLKGILRPVSQAIPPRSGRAFRLVIIQSINGIARSALKIVSVFEYFT